MYNDSPLLFFLQGLLARILLLIEPNLINTCLLYVNFLDFKSNYLNAKEGNHVIATKAGFDFCFVHAQHRRYLSFLRRKIFF